MSVYVNGRYLPYAHAKIHAEDRGFQFADAVYEVCEVKNGRLVDETRHVERLARRSPNWASRTDDASGLSRVMRETIRRNRVPTASSICRSPAAPVPRDFAFPPPDTPPRSCASRARLAAPARSGGRSGIARQDHARHPLGHAAISRPSCSADVWPKMLRARRAPKKHGSST